MSPDYDLLQLAASAVGYTGKWDAFWHGMCCGENHWDPLRHNHQAFRLLSEIAKSMSSQQLAEIISKDLPTFRRAIVTSAAKSSVRERSK